LPLFLCGWGKRMNETEILITSSSGYQKIAGFLRKGVIPRVLAIKTHPRLYEECALAFARLFLCHQFIGNDNCSSCRQWHEKSHPDLVLSGDPEKVPGIDVCREIHHELLLIPVISKYRVAVIYGLDRISVNAANSMLKFAEETPEKGIIIFLHEKDNILPTLQSRIWPVTVLDREALTPNRLPQSDPEWLEWIERVTREGTDAVQLSLNGWISYALEKKEYNLAGKLEKLRLIADNKKISNAMLSDLVFLSIKEGISFEHIFGDIW
jgi:DNA polymerase-3 subunit delta'